MKKIIVVGIVLAMVCAMFLTACAPATQETQPSESSAAGTEAATNTEEAKPAGEKYKIGVSWYALSTEFMAICKYYMDEYVAENYADKIELIHLDADSDAANQIDQVNNLISQEVDAILLNPFDKEQVAPATKEAFDAGIPVIEFNSETNASEEYKATYVGSDHTESGRMLARHLIEVGGEEANWVVLEGPTGHDGQVGRTKGMEEVLKDYPGIKIVGNKTCNWVREEAMAAMENFLQSGMEIDMVYAQNDEMGLGALAAIQGTEWEGKIVVGSIDGITDAMNAVRDNRLTCTVFQNAAGQARGAVDAALAYLAGEKLEKYIDVPYELITLDNVDDPKYDTSGAVLN